MKMPRGRAIDERSDSTSGSGAFSGEIPIGGSAAGETYEKTSAPHGSDSGQETTNSETDEGAEFPPEAFAGMAMGMLDVFCTRAYRMPLTEVERAMLAPPFTALARKYFGGPVSPEWAAVGAIAVVILPRYLTRRSEPAHEPGGADAEAPTQAPDAHAAIDAMMAGAAQG